MSKCIFVFKILTQKWSVFTAHRIFVDFFENWTKMKIAFEIILPLSFACDNQIKKLFSGHFKNSFELVENHAMFTALSFLQKSHLGFIIP